MKAKKRPRAPTLTTAPVKTTGRSAGSAIEAMIAAMMAMMPQKIMSTSLILPACALRGLVGRQDHALHQFFGVELPDVLLLSRRERIVDVSGDQDAHRLGSLVRRRP